MIRKVILYSEDDSLDNIQFFAQAPIAGYVTFGNVIAIFLAELTVFIAVIGIMMLWIGSQFNHATNRRETIASESSSKLEKFAQESQIERMELKRKLDNLMLLVATEKGLSVEEALRLIEETNKE